MAYQQKHTTIFTNILKKFKRYLLKQDGLHLLTQSGYKIVIQPVTSGFIDEIKHSTNWSNLVKTTLASYLLKEDTYFLLLENGDFVIIEPTE